MPDRKAQMRKLGAFGLLSGICGVSVLGIPTFVLFLASVVITNAVLYKVLKLEGREGKVICLPFSHTLSILLGNTAAFLVYPETIPDLPYLLIDIVWAGAYFLCGLLFYYKKRKKLTLAFLLALEAGLLLLNIAGIVSSLRWKDGRFFVLLSHILWSILNIVILVSCYM